MLLLRLGLWSTLFWGSDVATVGASEGFRKDTISLPNWSITGMCFSAGLAAVSVAFSLAGIALTAGLTSVEAFERISDSVGGSSF